jgi:hypothetical protein
MQMMLSQCDICGWATFESVVMWAELIDTVGYHLKVCPQCIEYLDKRRGMYKLADLREIGLVVSNS